MEGAQRLLFQLRTRRVEVKGKIRDYYYLPHPGAVAIIPRQDDRIVLICQFRPSIDQSIWEVPAGTLEPNEDPLECARRELAEETGYQAARIEKLGAFYVAPGYSAEYLHLYLAEELIPGEPSLDDGEQIEEIAWFTLDQARRMVDAGELVDAKSIIAVQTLLLRTARL